MILASPVLLSKVVTRWIATGEHALCETAANLVQEARRGDLIVEADPDEVPMKDNNSLAFIARKAVGYLFFWPVTATSFLVSLMRLGAVDSLKQLLLDPLLLNYTGSVQNFLQEQSKSEPTEVSRGIDECLQAIEDYLAKIRSRR